MRLIISEPSDLHQSHLERMAEDWEEKKERVLSEAKGDKE